MYTARVALSHYQYRLSRALIRPASTTSLGQLKGGRGEWEDRDTRAPIHREADKKGKPAVLCALPSIGTHAFAS